MKLFEVKIGHVMVKFDALDNTNHSHFQIMHVQHSDEPQPFGSADAL